MIPKTVAALDSGTVPDVAYADVYDVQVAGQVGVRGQARGHLGDILTPMKWAFAPNTLETALLYNDKSPRRRPTTPSRSSSRPCTSSTGRTCWSRPASRRATSRPSGRTTGRSGATRCSRPTPQGLRPARLRRRPADGRRIDRLVPVVPHLHGRLQRQAGRRRRQAPGRRSQGAGRPDQGAQGLHRCLHQGLHAALLDHLEGPGQQRRLPQQDDRADAQLHDLDRGEMARRRQQPDADAGTARRRARRTTTRPSSPPVPQQAGRHADQVPLRRQDRR